MKISVATTMILASLLWLQNGAGFWFTAGFWLISFICLIIDLYINEY